MDKILLSSNKLNWETPPEVFDPLDKEFRFTLDPCCEHSTAKCKKYFTVKEDGLSQSWQGEQVFCNPPYGRQLGKWVRKAFEEWCKGDCKIVLLMPARTDTSYFHDCVDGKAQVRFIRGRIKFLMNGEVIGRSTFPSMLAIFK